MKSKSSKSAAPGGVGRHHGPAYRLLSLGAVLMRYSHEGLPHPPQNGGQLRTASSRPLQQRGPCPLRGPTFVHFVFVGNHASPTSGVSKNISQSRTPQAGHGRRDPGGRIDGRIAWKVVGIVSVFPNSSSAAPLRPAWSIHGSARTPCDLAQRKDYRAPRACTPGGSMSAMPLTAAE